MCSMDHNIAEEAVKLVCYEKTEQRWLITRGGGLEMNFTAHLRKSIVRKIYLRSNSFLGRKICMNKSSPFLALADITKGIRQGTGPVSFSCRR